MDISEVSLEIEKLVKMYSIYTHRYMLFIEFIIRFVNWLSEQS